MSNDLTFFTNEPNATLYDRFFSLLKNVKCFDVLVGYFRTSGFLRLSESLEAVGKIRILVGLDVDRKTIEVIDEAKYQSEFDFESHSKTKEIYSNNLQEELNNSEDSAEIELGINKFIDFIKSGKLQIRAYPSRNIHAKVYIARFPEGHYDFGRVITGSSNFSETGLIGNREFNVELKNKADVDFALKQFEELWKDAVDINDKYIETIETKTWFNQDILPYYLYLKFLYEYFKSDLNRADKVFAAYIPENFMKLEYQEQAVINAKKILEEYGGVFVADVVGLGKTYIATLLAGQLDGRTLVIAPPVLLDEDNPGSWKNSFSDFRIAADFESIGKLDDILERGTEKYTNIIIDEAHRFRTETNVTYEMLAEVCRGKRVILVTATPYNNSPKDILSQIKLFQNSKKSTIPNLPDLDSFFSTLAMRLKGLDRQENNLAYLKIVKDNSAEIREKLLKYLMVRRTRTEIIKYFNKDLSNQKLRFPEVAAPKPLFYELNEEEDYIFNKTIELISLKFTYARYTPLLYLKKGLDHLEEQSQKNMGKFMKILLVKRLESSFYAFRNSIDRFINSYQIFIQELEKGHVYTSKKHIYKIFEYLEQDDDEAVQRLIDEGKAEQYNSCDFSTDFLVSLKNDLVILNEIQKLWERVERDPKLLELFKQLASNKLLKGNKIILFTESKETAEYLSGHINKVHKNQAVCFSGNSGEVIREEVIKNFDAKSKHPQDKYRILISTEVLSEGVNLHRSNVVINYDIPWNPTRMMQRVGRINRVDTKFDTIYTFNFFPTQQSNDEIKLKEAAEAKINAFLSLLGGDSALLTEGEPIGSHELFSRLVSKKTLTGEDEEEISELKYLTLIKDIRDSNPDLFEKIKKLPQKARSGKIKTEFSDSLLTYFRKGKIQKFFLSGKGSDAKELDFITAAGILESESEDKKKKLPSDFFETLNKNKEAFINSTTQGVIELQARKGNDSAVKILRILKAVFKDMKQLTEDQELYIKRVLSRLEEGALPKQTTKTVLKTLNELKNEVINPLKVLGVLQTQISSKLLESHFVEDNPMSTGKREVILSMYLSGTKNEL